MKQIKIRIIRLQDEELSPEPTLSAVIHTLVSGHVEHTLDYNISDNEDSNVSYLHDLICAYYFDNPTNSIVIFEDSLGLLYGDELRQWVSNKLRDYEFYLQSRIFKSSNFIFGKSK